MLKEIHEQTKHDHRRHGAGRLSREEATAKLGGLEMTNAELRRPSERIVITGCGNRPRTSAAWSGRVPHRGALGAHIPGRGSEFREASFAIGKPCRCPRTDPPLGGPSVFVMFAERRDPADSRGRAARERPAQGPPQRLGICNNQRVASTHSAREKRRRRLHCTPARRSARRGHERASPARSTILHAHLAPARRRNPPTSAPWKGPGASSMSVEAIPEKVAQILKQTDHIRENRAVK